MRFHSLLAVRDEGDIIAQCLEQQLAWADGIYVFDTGSVDDTWDIVQEFAARDRRIIPLRKDPVFFNDTVVRGWMFEQVRNYMSDGDWFLRSDADEFHHVAPPEFVRTRIRKHETIVWHQYYDFRLTESDVRAWESGEENESTRERAISERRRWFTTSSYSEPRLCRYRATMKWPSHASFPYNAGFVARARLPIRHYPHRDPLQLFRRCRLRAIMMADSENRRNWSEAELHHWCESDWRRFITPDGAKDLQLWSKGTELPIIVHHNHLAKAHIRILQRFTHAALVRFLDRWRLGWRAGTYPQRMPSSLQKEMAEIYARA